MSTQQPRIVAGRFRLLEPLGEGGMGRVWRARDEVLHRQVAIKELVPPPGLTPEERTDLQARSMREARAVARLDHPNVVRIFDVVEVGDGDPCIVMEYLPGRSLQQALVEGPLPVPEAARIGLDILQALAAAHAVGVVHRDVKPGNILLTTSGRAVLTDFGIAVVPDDPFVTRTGLLLGSPAYLAPERARPGTTTAASDLWSLGATLYAATEGRSPFARTTAIETLTALTTEPVPPPEQSGPLTDILLELLQKDPDARPDIPTTRRMIGTALATAEAGHGPEPEPQPIAAPTPPVEPPPVEPPPTEPPPVEPEPAAGAAPEPPEPAAPEPPTEAAPAPAPAAEPATEPTASEPTASEPAPTPAGAAPARRRRRFAVLAGAVGFALLVALAAVIADRVGDDPVPRAEEPPADQPAPIPETDPDAADPDAEDPDAENPDDEPTGGGPVGQGAQTAPGQPEDAELPDGWQLRDDGTGFQVPVPDGWEFGRDRDGRALWQDPATGRLLLIDQTRQPQPDPVQDWENNEQARRGGYADYDRIRLESVSYWEDAADWEFTYTLNGTPVRVLNRGFVTAPDQAYSIYWRTPADTWEDHRDDLQVVLDGFVPARTT